MGRRLLPFGWSVVDDATMDPQLNGSYAYDAQGVSPKRVELVEDGVVKDLLMTRIPRAEFTESTGHARASGGDRYVAFPSVVTVKPKRHTNERKLFKKGVQLAKQTGNEYVLVIKYLEPLALSEDFEVAFTGDEQLSGAHHSKQGRAALCRWSRRARSWTQVCRCGQTSTQRHRTRRSSAGLRRIDGRRRRSLLHESNRWTTGLLVRAFYPDFRDGTQWSRWRR